VKVAEHREDLFRRRFDAGRPLHGERLGFGCGKDQSGSNHNHDDDGNSLDHRFLSSKPEQASFDFSTAPDRQTQERAQHMPRPVYNVHMIVPAQGHP
jgi:hypothetical protein